jgi:branched-chain amino acid transport system permease protein
LASFLPFIISGLGIGAVYALSGVGLTVLYRATSVLNLAYGALGALAAFLAWTLIEEEGLAPILAAFAGIGAATAVSLAYGRLVAPRLAYRDRMVRAVGTLGLALILLGLIGWTWGEAPRRLLFPTDRLYADLFGARLTYTRALALLTAVAMVLGIGVVLARTRLGLSMRALADSRDVSAVIGIRVLSVESAAWAISGVFAGISGIFLGDLVRLHAFLLTFLVIPAVAAAIVGRLSSLGLTVAAGLGIGLAEALLTPFAAIAPFRTAVPFLVALAAIALFPTPRAAAGDP